MITPLLLPPTTTPLSPLPTSPAGAICSLGRSQESGVRSQKKARWIWLLASGFWLLASGAAEAQLRFVRYCTNAVDLVAVNPNGIDLVAFVKDLSRFYFYSSASAIATNTPYGPFKPAAHNGRWLEITMPPTGGPVDGAGTAPYLAVWTGTNTLGNAQAYTTNATNIAFVGLPVIPTGAGSGKLLQSDASGVGSWQTVSSGITINPTDNRIPYRQNSTTFGDSAWHYISVKTNALGFNSTNFFIYSDPTQFTVGIGSRALFSHTTGDDNTVMGVGAATNLTTGTGNVIIGTRSAEELMGGGDNTIVGAHTFQGGTNVYDNTVVGYQALLGGNENTTIGSFASYSTTGDNNVAAGFAAHRDLTSGNRNVALGTYSARRLTTGSDNIMLGYYSGTNLLSGSETIFIGRQTTASNTGDTNTIVLGHYANSRGSNTAQIGTNGVTVLYLNGSVGWFRGSGTPEAAVTAPVGSFFTREDGGAGTSWYVKESGTGNTGWVAK